MDALNNFDELLNWRRSIRAFDDKGVYDPAVITRCLNRSLLAPTSSNLQLFEIYRVNDPEKKEELARHCLGQPAATTARELVVFVVRRDLWPKRAHFNHEILKERFAENLTKQEKNTLLYYSKVMPLVYSSDPLGLVGLAKKFVFSIIGIFRPVYRQVSLTDTRIIAHKSCALVAQTFMLGIAAEGYDSCPMEGVDTSRVRRFLRLPCSAEINMVIAVGRRKPEGVYGERLRLDPKDLIFTI